MQTPRYRNLPGSVAISLVASLIFSVVYAQPELLDDSTAPVAATGTPALDEAPPVADESAVVPTDSAAANATPAANAVPAEQAGGDAVQSAAPAAEAVATDAVAVPTLQPAPPAKPRYNKDDVRWIQQRLQELGYYDGAIDGAYGRVTRDAIKSYQVDQELEQDGRPTPELREFMWRNGG